jgi:hypothetical protein
MSTPKTHVLTHIFLHHTATIFHKLSIRAQIFDLDHGQSTMRPMILGCGQGKKLENIKADSLKTAINLRSTSQVRT